MCHYDGHPLFSFAKTANGGKYVTMESELSPNRYFIWGIDEAPYGPVPLNVLTEWVTDERVAAATWV